MRRVTSFMVVLGIMLLSFIGFFYFKLKLVTNEEKSLNVFDSVKRVGLLSMGDFGGNEEYDLAQWVTVVVGILLLTLMMMNLLIGLISDQLERVLESQ